MPWTSSFPGDTRSVFAPAVSSAFRGSVISTCSNPSVTRIATLHPSSRSCIVQSSLGRSGGLDVHTLIGDLGQLLVRRRFFVECLLQYRCGPLLSELLRVRADGPVCRDFVMLHALARGNDGRVAHRRRRVLADHLVPFVQNAFH